MSFFSLPTAQPPSKKAKSLVKYEESEDDNDDSEEEISLPSTTPCVRYPIGLEEDDNDDSEEKNMWTAVWSQTHGAFYYHKDGETTWDLPDGATYTTSNSTESSVVKDDAQDGDSDAAKNEDDRGFVAPYLVEPRTVTVAGTRSKTQCLDVIARAGQHAIVEAIYQPNRDKDTVFLDIFATTWCVRFTSEQGVAAALALDGSPLDASGAARDGNVVTISRTVSKHMALVEQPTKVFLRHVPLDATDPEIAAFVLHTAETSPNVRVGSGVAAGESSLQLPVGVHVFRIKSNQSFDATSNPPSFSGCCVVSLPSAQAAARAVADRNGQVLETARGSKAAVSVVISHSRIWEGVSENGQSSERAAVKTATPARPEGCQTVWIGGLPKDCDEEQCRSVLAQCGTLASFRFIRDQNDGDCKGFAFATFQSFLGAEAAVGTLNGAPRLGTKLKVKHAADKRGVADGTGKGSKRRV